MTAPFPRVETHDEISRPPCQDCSCFIVFALLSLGIVYSVFWSVAQGGANIDRLTRPMDYNGNICGVDAAVADAPYLYICGKSDAGWDGKYPKALDFKSKSCVKTCPSKNDTSIPCITRPYVYPKPTHGGVGTDGVQYLETLSFEISQSVSLQTAYPTEVYKGQICAPKFEAPNDLRNKLLLGPHSTTSSFAQAFGSLSNAWPVLLGVAILANILSYAYIVVLSYYAGPLLLLSLAIGTILIGIFALFFIIGIFFSPFDENGGYNTWNPIYRSVYGEEARLLTFLMGIFLAGICALMVRTTRHSVDRIDEAVGLIFAALGCIFDRNSWCTIRLIPLVSAAVTLAVLAVLVYCFMLILSVGDIDSTGITVNGNDYVTMQKNIKYPKYWPFVIFLYVVFCVWIVELITAITQFIISFNVCEWFFVVKQCEENKDISSLPFQQAYKGQGQPVQNVRVHGVDAVLGGKRTGYIEEDTVRGRGKVLVVPIGEKHPDGRDFHPETAEIEIKPHDLSWSIKGFLAAITHIGTLVLATWPVLLSRPFRMIGQIIKFLMTPASSSVDRKPYKEDEENTFSGLLTSFGGLASGWINYYFGGWSRDAYVHIILSASNWKDASEEVHDFILKSGGAVAFLHGMTSIYEIIAIFFVTVISSFTGYCFMSNLDLFHEDDSEWYIQDPLAMTYLAVIISVVVSFNWIALFNNTSDTLLYVFAWARQQRSLDDEGFPDLETLCPETLLAILRPELVQGPTEAFKSDTKSQVNRFNHAHKKFAGNAYSYVTQGKSQLTFGDGERESLLKSSR